MSRSPIASISTRSRSKLTANSAVRAIPVIATSTTMSFRGIHRRTERSNLYSAYTKFIWAKTDTGLLSGIFDRIEIVRRQVAGYVLPDDPGIQQVQNKTQLVGVPLGQIPDSPLLHFLNPLFLDATVFFSQEAPPARIRRSSSSEA